MGKPTLLPKGRSLSSEMTDLVAEAAGNLAKTAVKAAAKKGRTAVAERLPRPVKRAANTIEAPKKTAKKTARKSSSAKKPSHRPDGRL
jgi:hypothetical protein